MHLLQSGVDITVIALWLGHESVETTQMYLHADLSIKEKAIARTNPLPDQYRRYQPDDRLCYEINHNDPKQHPEGKHVVDICVPVRPL